MGWKCRASWCNGWGWSYVSLSFCPLNNTGIDPLTAWFNRVTPICWCRRNYVHILYFRRLQRSNLWFLLNKYRYPHYLMMMILCADTCLGYDERGRYIVFHQHANADCGETLTQEAPLDSSCCRCCGCDWLHGGRWGHRLQRRWHAFRRFCHTLIGRAVMRW